MNAKRALDRGFVQCWSVEVYDGDYCRLPTGMFWANVPVWDRLDIGEYQYSDDNYDYYKAGERSYRVSSFVIRQCVGQGAPKL